MAKLKTTQLSLNRLRDGGWTVQVTEKWNPFAKVRQDLFGFIDILAIHDERGILGVQTTSFDAMRRRLQKIAKLHTAQIFLAAGAKIEVHGWAKVGGRMVCKVIRYPEAKLP